MTGVAVFGAGAIGTVHARNVAGDPTAQLLWCIDPVAERAEALARSHGGRASTDIGSALDDPAVEAVIISSSTSVHHAHVLATAEAGKAMLCEKPVADSLGDAVECVEAVRAKGLVAAIGFNRRLDDAYRTLRDRVDSGEIGRIEAIHIVSRSASAPPPATVTLSGGMVREKGAHFFDLAAWCVGSEPVEVSAMGGCLIDPGFADYGDVDTAAINLRFESGAIASFSFGRRTSFGYQETLDVFGECGLLEARRHRSIELSLYKGSSVTEEGLPRSWFERFAPTYGREVSTFLRAVRGEAPVHASLADGLRAQAIAEAVIEALASGGTVAIDRIW